MAGIKRKSAAPAQIDTKSSSKKIRVEKPAKKSSAKSEAKPPKKSKVQDQSEELVESDTSEDENGFYGFSANEDPDVEDAAARHRPKSNAKSQKSDGFAVKKTDGANWKKSSDNGMIFKKSSPGIQFYNITSSHNLSNLS